MDYVSAKQYTNPIAREGWQDIHAQAYNRYRLVSPDARGAQKRRD
jgi:hypothetical protein